MAKKNWSETSNDRLPAERKNHESLFSNFFGLDDYPTFSIRNILGDPSLSPLHDMMGELDGVGFQDFGDHYEMVTELGGNGDVKEDAVKIELLHEDTGAYVKVTYEHNTKTEHSHYSHSQTTCVTLPKDADEETVSAHFDEKNRVVVTVDKKVQEKQNHSRNIPIKGV